MNYQRKCDDSVGEQHVVKALNMADPADAIENERLVLEATGKDLLQDEHLKKAYFGM